MFAGNADTIPASLKFDTNLRTKPVAITTGNVHPTDTGKTVTTDKTQPVTQNKPTVLLSNNFRQTLGKKIMAKTSLNAPADKKTKKQGRDSATLHKMPFIPAADMAQQIRETPAILEKTNTTSLTAKTTKTIAAKSDQIASSIPKLVNRPIQITIDQGQIKSEIILPGISNKLPISNTQFEKDKDIGKAQVSDEAFVAKEKLVNQDNGKELLQEVLFSYSKTSTAGKKPIVTDKTSVSESPKTLETNKTAITSKAITDQKSGQEPASQMHAGDSKISIASERPLTIDKSAVAASRIYTSDKPAIATKPVTSLDDGRESMHETHHRGAKITITNKPFVLDSAKTQLSNATFAAPGDQSSLSQQKELTGQEIPTQAEETTPNKADINQKDHRGKTELFELPEKNRVQVESSSVKPIAQKMNQQRTQLSASQAENRSNSASNQTSTPDMELGEQVFVGGNVQPGITEQSSASPASAAFAKIASNADSGASVGEQIQESIHSSFHSGSRQIVIRLNPPELGKVVMKFAEQGGDITGLLQVDKPQTRDQLQQMLPEMIQNLQNSGIGIKRLEVVLTNQQDQYALKDQSSTAGQNGWSGHQSSPNPESQQNNATYNQWLTNVDNVIEFTEPQMHLASNSINMLV